MNDPQVLQQYRPVLKGRVVFDKVKVRPRNSTEYQHRSRNR